MPRPAHHINKFGTYGRKPKKELTGTISVRLNANTRYMLDLISRLQKNSLSSAIEWCIREAIKDPKTFGSDNQGLEPLSLYSSESLTRFLLLIDQAPHLLSEEEQLIWAEILHCSQCWIRGKIALPIKSEESLKEEPEYKFAYGVDARYIEYTWGHFIHNALGPDSDLLRENQYEKGPNKDESEPGAKEEYTRLEYPINRRWTEDITIPMSERKLGCVFFNSSMTER